LTTITKYDPLNVPNAVKLYTENVPEMDSDVDEITIPPLNAEIEKAGKMVEDVQDEILNEDNNITDNDIADKTMSDEELLLLQQAENDDIQADVEMLNKDVPE
jgi:hypothetical protein